MMGNIENSNHRIIHIERCGGIPKYPKKYQFDMSRPENIADEEIITSKIRVRNFLKKYGIDVSEGGLSY